MWRNGTGLAVFLGTASYGFYLGNWQIRRKREKEEFLQSRHAALKSKPQLLDLSSTPLSSAMDRIVLLKGKLDFEKQIFHGPRTSPVRKHSAELPGYFLYTPLRLESGQTILVNCGWIPRSVADNSKVVQEPFFHSNEVEVVGVVKRGAKKAPWYLPQEVDPRFWVFLELTRAEAELGVDPTAVVDAIEICPLEQQYDGPSDTLVPVLKRRDKITDVPITPATHLIYATTWYSLGLIGGIVGLTRFGKPLLMQLRRQLKGNKGSVR